MVEIERKEAVLTTAAQTDIKVISLYRNTSERVEVLRILNSRGSIRKICGTRSIKV
jgi:hypothetical protein